MQQTSEETAKTPDLAADPGGADQQGQQQNMQKQQATQEQQATTPSTSQRGCLGNVLYAIHSPWLLVTIPLLVGGIWLINNTWIITNNLDKPYALLAGPVFVGSILAGWLTFTFFRTIQAWCKMAWRAFFQARKEDGSAQFFWLVIIVFMIVSVFASGDFFTMLEHNALPGLGYATALFIDLVAVQSMRARLNAVRMRDKRGALLYLLGVFVCAGASAFANVYTSLADFAQKVSGVLPTWMLNAAPWFGLVFPALILLLSITADYTLDQTSTKLDPENYEKQEKKRLKLLEIQRDMLQARVAIEKDIDRLSAHLKVNEREFFLVRWLFPKKPINTQQVIAEVTEQIYAEFGKRMQSQYTQIHGEIVQAYTAATTQNTTQIQGVQQSVDQLEFEVNLLVTDWNRFKNTMTVETIIDQIKTRESRVNVSTNRGLHTHEIASQSARNGRAQGQKSITFVPSKDHKKALEFLQKHPEWQPQFAEIIRSNPTSGFEQIATFLRHQGMTHVLVTGPFVAEVLSLQQLQSETSGQSEQTTRSPKTASKTPSRTVASETVKTVKGPQKPVNEGEQEVKNHPSVSPGEHIHEEKTPAAATSDTTDHQISEEHEQATRDPETDHEHVAISATPVPEHQPDLASIPGEIDANMPLVTEQHTEAIAALTTKSTQDLSEETHPDGQENTLRFSEGFSSESGSAFSTDTQQFDIKTAGTADQFHQDFHQQEVPSPPGFFANMTEAGHENGQEFGTNFAEDERDEDHEFGTNSESSTRRGPYHLTAQEVAEKYTCLLDQVKYAVELGQLRLSNRTNQESDPVETWKILTSSLEGWTPPQLPKKRGRPKKQQEAELVVGKVG